MPNEEARKKTVRKIISLLPPSDRAIFECVFLSLCFCLFFFRALLSLFHLLHFNASEQNKMDCLTIATIFAPILMGSPFSLFFTSFFCLENVLRMKWKS